MSVPVGEEQHQPGKSVSPEGNGPYQTPCSLHYRPEISGIETFSKIVVSMAGLSMSNKMHSFAAADEDGKLMAASTSMSEASTL